MFRTVQKVPSTYNTRHLLRTYMHFIYLTNCFESILIVFQLHTYVYWKYFQVKSDGQLFTVNQISFSFELHHRIKIPIAYSCMRSHTCTGAII